MSQGATPSETQETPSQTALPQPGEWVAERFQIIRVIGRGGFGMVYEARQKSMGHRRIALKILAPRRSQEPKAAERFRQEAMLASRLRHPNTITLFDFGATEQGLFYIAMEYLEGQTLNAALRHAALPPERAERVTRQILGSLAEAHALGLIHRDLKPDNVFLCRVFGESDLVKVLDFGLAKMEGVLDDQGSSSAFFQSQRTDLTQEGLVCGTPDYMAPEQARGQPLTPACDVYAVGLLIYQMLTRQKPFLGKTPLEVLQKQAQEPLPALPPQLASTHLAQVMEIATRKQAQLRYRDAGHMLQALTGQADLDPARAPTRFGYEVQVDLDSRPLGQPTSVGVALTDEDLTPQPLLTEANSTPQGEIPTAEPMRPLEPSQEEPDPGQTHQGMGPDAWQSTTQSTRRLEEARAATPLEREPPLVGRAEELGRVLEATRGALEERAGAVVLCRGATGVGKTRLLQEVERVLTETSDALLLRARLRWPDAQPHQAMGKLVGQLLEVPPHRARVLHHAQQLTSYVRELLQRRQIALEERDAALLAELMVHQDEDEPQAGARSSLTLARLSRLVLQVAQQRPLVLLVEDLHSADHSSLELLRRLCSALTRQQAPLRGLCLCLTMRSEVPAHHPEVLRLLQFLERSAQGVLITVNIPPLGPVEAQQLVEAILPVEPGLRQQIAEAAYHNPRHILELMEHLAGQQRLVQPSSEEPWQLRDRHEPLSLPQDMGEVLRMRVADVIGSSRAPEAMQELLYRLAVLGTRVPPGLLRLLLELEQRPWPAQLQDRLLHELRRAGLVHLEASEGEGERPSQHQAIHFEDGLLPELLLREVASSLAGGRLHRSAARAKRAYYGDHLEAHAHELAGHLLLAGEPAEALPLLLQAARYAQGRGDFQVAQRRYQRLENLLARYPELNQAPLRHALWLELGTLNLRMGRQGPASIYLETLREELEAAPEAERGPQQQEARIRCALRLVELRIAQKRYGAASEGLRHALRLASTGQHWLLELEAQILQGELTLMERGPSSEGRIQALEQRLEEIKEQAPLLQARGLLHLSAEALARQDLVAAERHLEASRRVAAAQGDPGLQAAALSDLGLAVLLQGRTAQGQALLRESQALYRELGDRSALSVCLYRLGMASWRRQDLEQAQHQLERALHIQQELALDEYAAETLALLGRVQESQGSLSGASQAYLSALGLPIHRPPEMEAELQMRLGITALKQGQPEPARRWLEGASQRFAVLGQVASQVQCLNLLAMATSWRREITQAQALLHQSLQLAAQREDRPGELFALLATCILGALAPLPSGQTPAALLERARAQMAQDQAPKMELLLQTAERILQGHGLASISPKLPELQRAWLEQLLGHLPG